MDNLNMPPKYLNLVINGWLLGADPEWAVITPPDAPVPNAGQNAVNTTRAAGSIGSDHGGRVWELRPAPSPSAYAVALNLWKLLRQEELDKVSKFKWKSGALGARKNAHGAVNAGLTLPTTLQGWVQNYTNMGYSNLTATQMAHQSLQQQQALQAQAANTDTLGGHVHFGLQGLNPAQRKALNDATTGLLNLDILPHKENLKRLAITQNGSPKYGHFDGGDAVRDCDGHVEYRCAPSWLDKPGQALAALTTYKLAAARPSSVRWPESYSLKSGFVEWLEELSQAPDVDAWILGQFIDRLGFSNIQADPSSDFKDRWRRENPWER